MFPDKELTVFQQQSGHWYDICDEKQDSRPIYV